MPLWFRPDNPTSKPIVSHLASTNNVLLKITVPKRTGRKRKRGSNEPYVGDFHVPDGVTITGTDEVSSVSRRDTPKSILRKMQDNVDDYQIEAVGGVQDTHRYRGLADFQFANTSSSFLTNIAEHLLPMQGKDPQPSPSVFIFLTDPYFSLKTARSQIYVGCGYRPRPRNHTSTALHRQGDRLQLQL